LDYAIFAIFVEKVPYIFRTTYYIYRGDTPRDASKGALSREKSQPIRVAPLVLHVPFPKESRSSVWVLRLVAPETQPKTQSAADCPCEILCVLCCVWCCCCCGLLCLCACCVCGVCVIFHSTTRCNTTPRASLSPVSCTTERT